MVAVIVLNYNTPYQTIECVNSIIMNEKSVEIIVVDNCSTDDSANILEKYCHGLENVNFIITKYNGGYSYGNNYGAKFISDKVEKIVFSNSDVIFKNNTIEFMENMLDSDNKLAVVGPSVISLENKEIQFARRPITCVDYLLGRRPFCWLSINSGRFIRWNRKGRIRFAGMVCGCCFMIKRSVFEELNGFDENVFLYAEEDILAYKLKESNYTAGICPQAKVLHKHSQSISKRGQAFLRKYSLLSPLYALKVFDGQSRILFMICCADAILQYGIYAIIDSKYRKEFKDFIYQLNQIRKKDKIVK